MDLAEYVRAKRPIELHSERSDHGRVSSGHRKTSTNLGDVVYHLCSSTCLRTLYTELSDASGVGLRYADELENLRHMKPETYHPKD